MISHTPSSHPSWWAHETTSLANVNLKIVNPSHHIVKNVHKWPIETFISKARQRDMGLICSCECRKRNIRAWFWLNVFHLGLSASLWDVRVPAFTCWSQQCYIKDNFTTHQSLSGYDAFISSRLSLERVKILLSLQHNKTILSLSAEEATLQL